MSLFQVTEGSVFHIDRLYIFLPGYYVRTDEDLDQGKYGERFRRLPEPPSVETIADVAIACKWWLRRYNDKTIAPYAGRVTDHFKDWLENLDRKANIVGTNQEQYLVEFLAELVDRIAEMPDVPPVPFGSEKVKVARGSLLLVTRAKEFMEWAENLTEAPQAEGEGPSSTTRAPDAGVVADEKFKSIIEDENLSAEQKLVKLSYEYCEFYSWNSTRLGRLVGVSPAAIRGLDWWKVTRKQYLEKEKRDNEPPSRNDL